MNVSDSDLDAMLKRLHLANARRIQRDLVRPAEKEQWSYRDFLATLAAEEVACRQQTRLSRLVRHAGFPFLKTVDDFDFTHQSTLRLQMLGSALSPDFVTDGRCRVLLGRSGRGKTHLAVAIAYRAIQNGFDAKCTTAAALIDDLSRAGAEGRLQKALAAYTHPHVLVVDEVGYLTYGTDAANVLFHVVNERHLRRRSMIFTTNKDLRVWGKVLHDDLAAAIVDRILERGRILRLDGPSFRTKHLGLDDPAAAELPSSPVATISGTDRPDFPEPARRLPRADRAPSRRSPGARDRGPRVRPRRGPWGSRNAAGGRPGSPLRASGARRACGRCGLLRPRARRGCGARRTCRERPRGSPGSARRGARWVHASSSGRAGGRPGAPRVEPAGGDPQHAARRRDRVDGLVGAPEPGPLLGVDSVFRANQAAALLRDLPLLAEHAILASELRERLLRVGGQPVGAPAVIEVRLAHPVSDRRRGRLERLREALGRPPGPDKVQPLPPELPAGSAGASSASWHPLSPSGALSAKPGQLQEIERTFA